jgi:uncharacterized coiled-coil protein SlyX
MNKGQRKQISALIDKLDEIRTEMEQLGEDEQEKFDNMPEGIQDSERGDKMQEAADMLAEQSSAIEDIQSTLLELIES